MPLTVRSVIDSLPVYKAGKSADRPEGLTPDRPTYKLSSNENPFPPLPGVLAATALACEQMNRYPDIANTQLADAVARKFDIGADLLAFGTGSVAVLYHLLQAVCDPGDEVIFAWRSFEAYPIAVLITGATPVPVPLATGAVHDLDAMRAKITPATKAIMLCTPNNPTGPAIPHDDVVRFIDEVPDSVLVVVDEAYVEFVTDPGATRGLDVMGGRPNVAVLRTFSKAYGLAGFRVGFCVADPKVASAVRAVSLPFGVSLPAQAAVLASLDAEAALLERVAQIVSARTLLVEGLTDLGFQVPHSQANFVWLPAGPRTLDYAATFAEAGLAVRPYAAGTAGDGVRITVGEPEANQRVLQTAAQLPR
jgi:histidinol-phosphate aminotransferase